MIIIPTSNSHHLAKKLKQKTNCKVLWPTKNRDGKRIFPDGEVYSALPNISQKEKYLILHCGMPNPNNSLIELKIILEILKSKKVSEIKILFSYFPYGMQDDVFDPGEINVAESFIRELTKYYKTTKIYTLDAHFFGKKWLTKYPVINIKTLDFIKRIVVKKYPNVVFLAPDTGCQNRTGLKGVDKKRFNSTKTELKNTDFLKDLVKDKVVGVVDDIIETGGTMERFAKECRKKGAKKMVAIITHGVLAKGIKRVKKNYDKLFLTNSIKRSESNIDITDLIIEKLKL